MSTLKKSCLLLLALPLAFLLVVNLLPYLYTPSALTEKKQAVYERVVTFVKDHPKLGDIEIHSGGRILIQRRSLWLDDRQYLRELLSETDIAELIELWQAMQEAGCADMKTEKGMVLFYPHFSYLLPHPPRVLYSLKGDNPNNTGGILVRGLRPYYHLQGRWYASSKHPGPWRGGY